MSQQKRKKKEFKIDLGRTGARKLSSFVQEHAFNLGYNWQLPFMHSDIYDKGAKARYLILNGDESIFYYGELSRTDFENYASKEISVADFLELKKEDTFAEPEIEMVEFYNPVFIVGGDLGIKNDLLTSMSGHLTDGKFFKRFKDVKLWGDPVAKLPVDKETRKVVWERVDKE